MASINKIDVHGNSYDLVDYTDSFKLGENKKDIKQYMNENQEIDFNQILDAGTYELNEFTEIEPEDPDDDYTYEPTILNGPNINVYYGDASVILVVLRTNPKQLQQSQCFDGCQLVLINSSELSSFTYVYMRRFDYDYGTTTFGTWINYTKTGAERNSIVVTNLAGSLGSVESDNSYTDPRWYASGPNIILKPGITLSSQTVYTATVDLSTTRYPRYSFGKYYYKFMLRSPSNNVIGQNKIYALIRFYRTSASSAESLIQSVTIASNNGSIAFPSANNVDHVIINIICGNYTTDSTYNTVVIPYLWIQNDDAVAIESPDLISTSIYYL